MLNRERYRRVGRLARQDGFSLVEMLVASFLFLVVMSAMLALFSSQSSVAHQANQRTDLLANARAAMDVITKDLRIAGANMPEGAAYAFIDGDNAPVGASSGNGLTTGTDAPASNPDYIEIMYAAGQGAACSFSLSETITAGTMQNAVLPVPAIPPVTPSDLEDLMLSCAHSYRNGASCSDVWIVESDDGSFSTIIEARAGASPPDNAYMVLPDRVDILHTPDANGDINVPTGLPGSAQNAAIYQGGRIRLANDFKRVAYRIGGQNTDHPALQRAEANHCSANWDADDNGAPDDSAFVTIAENIEDLQFSFAYLSATSELDNLNGILETSGGTAPYFRYPPSSYNYDEGISPPAGSEPIRIRYIRVSIVVRTEQVDRSKRGYGVYGGGAAVDDIANPAPGLGFNEPVFFNRPRVENRLANTTLDGRARIFLQEVVDIRNLNLPPV